MLALVLEKENMDEVEYLPDHCTRIVYMDGDIFDSPYSKAHTVSADLHMGRGVAKLFRVKYRHVQMLFNQRCEVGEVAILTPKETLNEGEYIFYLITKTRYFCKPTMKTLRKAVANFIYYLRLFKIAKVSIPMIATGLDMMSWETVYNILAKELNKIPAEEKLLIIVHRYDDDLDKQSLIIRLPIKTITGQLRQQKKTTEERQQELVEEPDSEDEEDEKPKKKPKIKHKITE